VRQKRRAGYTGRQHHAAAREILRDLPPHGLDRRKRDLRIRQNKRRMLCIDVSQRLARLLPPLGLVAEVAQHQEGSLRSLRPAVVGRWPGIVGILRRAEQADQHDESQERGGEREHKSPVCETRWQPGVHTALTSSYQARTRS
jgi:hypothetical protein